MALGLQQSMVSLLGLALAIIFHKWSEGLTIGLLYRKEGHNKTTINAMILVQSFINVGGLLVGLKLSEEGDLISGIFMSIAAGTFLYISLGEILP